MTGRSSPYSDKQPGSAQTLAPPIGLSYSAAIILSRNWSMLNSAAIRNMPAIIAGLILSLPVLAEPLWVSDEFEVLLRTGPSTNNAIVLMVTSGTRLEVLEKDAESGYSRVRTAGGTEGWVLSRYLMGEPSAREQLRVLSGQLTNESAKGASMSNQLGSIKSEYDKATQDIARLEQDRSGLQQELADIQQKAANTLAIDRQNKSLQQQLTDAEIKVSILEEENDKLAGQTTRNWFITGALVLFFGMVIGLVLPKMKLQRRSRYDRF